MQRVSGSDSGQTARTASEGCLRGCEREKCWVLQHTPTFPRCGALFASWLRGDPCGELVQSTWVTRAADAAQTGLPF
eukprot:2629391-Prymnesium_polylepis.1